MYYPRPLFSVSTMFSALILTRLIQNKVFSNLTTLFIVAIHAIHKIQVVRNGPRKTILWSVYFRFHWIYQRCRAKAWWLVSGLQPVRSCCRRSKTTPTLTEAVGWSSTNGSSLTRWTIGSVPDSARLARWTWRSSAPGFSSNFRTRTWRRTSWKAGSWSASSPSSPRARSFWRHRVEVSYCL